MAAYLDMVRCQSSCNRERSRPAYMPNLRQRRDSPHIEPALNWVSRLRFVIYGIRQQHGNPVYFLITVRGARSKARRDNTEIQTPLKIRNRRRESAARKCSLHRDLRQRVLERLLNDKSPSQDFPRLLPKTQGAKLY